MTPATVALVILAIALTISLYVNFLGGKPALVQSKGAADNQPAPRAAGRAEEPDRSSKKELEKKSRELEELKVSVNDLKNELKDAKKKLFEFKEANKSDSDLVKARAEVERQASVQLEATRAELATALADVQKLKGEAEGKGKRRSSEAPVAAAPVAQAEGAAPAPQVVVQKVIRELNDGDREKMVRLELDAKTSRAKAAEFERDLKVVKGRAESNSRQLRSSRDDLALVKDKFRAIEKRLNRTLLERDGVIRALHDLEKKSGIAAERFELTAEQIAASDLAVEDKLHAEDEARRAAQARIEAEAVSASTPSEAPAAAAAVVPETTVQTTSPTA